MLIGKNQVDEDEEVGYATLMGAFEHVYTSSLGGFNTDSYFDS